MAVILHDVWALLAGFVVIMTLIYAFTLLLARLAPEFVGPSEHPQSRYLVAGLGYSFVAAIGGGYVTAWVAAVNPLPKVLMLAIVVLAVSTISALDTRGQKPVGLQLAGAVLGAAGVVLGGVIRLHFLGLL
jgi:multisubunit Na+/H+ antiporter MnhC subunit